MAEIIVREAEDARSKGRKLERSTLYKKAASEITWGDPYKSVAEGVTNWAR